MAENKSSSSKSLLIFVIVLFALITALCINIYIYYPALKNYPPVVVQPTVTMTPESTIVPAPNIDTSTWQTYKNEEYGFEFKYPSDYQVVDERKENNSIKIISPKKYFHEDWQVYVSYDITLFFPVFSPDAQSLKSIKSGSKWESEKPFLINGYNALLLGGFNSKYRDDVYIFTDKDTYLFINYENFIDDHSRVFQGVYSSFKVIE